MTFDVLEKTPEVAPLLVRLYDTHNLYALAENRNSEEACAELTTVMVDLLNIRLSDRESELITDVLLGLMKQAETDLKAALADRLSGMESVPLRMILGLANDDIKVADPILRNSPLLQDLDLVYILQAKGLEHGRSIALRSGLSGTVINMLADTKDFQIAVNLSENNGITLTEHAFDIFADMAKDSERLARPLLSRDDLPQEVAGKLYQFVGEELKKMLKERYGIGAGRAIAALEDITVEMLENKQPTHFDTHDQLLAYAHNQNRRGELKLSGMISALRRGQYSTFMAQFSVFCALPLATMKGVLKQESGKALAIACKAMDIQKADFVSLYLLCERFRTGAKKVVSHKELTRIMTMYDEIDPEKARQIMRDSRN
jgi:uncharacterized protein (DUF2336 family)